MNTTRRGVWGVGLTLWMAACGGTAHEEHESLFSGSPGALLPHEVGRTTRFLVTARSEGNEISTVLTARVLADGPHGEFIVERTPDGGRPRRTRARETVDRIVLEAVATEADSGFTWTEVDPPAVLVRTPVIAGRSERSRFVRTLDVLVRIDERPAARSVTFEGESVRTATARENVEVGGRTVEAIAFEIRGDGRASRVPGLGDAELRLELRGTEYVAPGIGLVREELELAIAVGSAHSRVELTSERLAGGE